MAQELHYGSVECLQNPRITNEDSALLGEKCFLVKDEESCLDDSRINASVEFRSTNGTLCVWDHSGLGLEYQVLAGPSFIAVFTISGIFWGILGDKFSRPLLLKIATGILTIAITLVGFTSAYWQLVILRMLIGAGDSAISPVSMSLLSEAFEAENRGLAVGIFNWGIYFGYGLSYILGNFLAGSQVSYLNWRLSHFVSGILGVVAFVASLLFVKDNDPTSNCKEDISNTYSIKYMNDVTGPPDDSIELKTKDFGTYHHKNEDSDEVESLNMKHKCSKGLCRSFAELLNPFLNSSVIFLTIAACVRHTAGFTWAYNTQLYFSTYYPNYNLGVWISAVSIGGGTAGVAIGGLVSDKFVKKIGLKARAFVLFASQMIATPFAIGVLYLRPPAAFYSLLASYLFAEMWFGVLYATLLDLLPQKTKTTSLAVFIFIINNVGGTAPLLVEPIRNAISYRNTLMIMYPGFYFVSAVLFFLSAFFLPNLQKKTEEPMALTETVESKLEL